MASLDTGLAYALSRFRPQEPLQLECDTSTTSREAETSEGRSVCTRSWEKKQLQELKLTRRSIKRQETSPFSQVLLLL